VHGQLAGTLDVMLSMRYSGHLNLACR